MIKTTSMLTSEPKRYGFSKSNSLYLFVLRFLRAGRNTAAPATSTAAGTMISSVGTRCKIDRFGGYGLSASESVNVSSPSGRPGSVSAYPLSVLVKPSMPHSVM